LQCDLGYIASGEVTCMEDGSWAGASCLFECPHLTMTGDCFRLSNQVYDLQPDLVAGKPHYIGVVSHRQALPALLFISAYTTDKSVWRADYAPARLLRRR
jgi:hypothetical protein